MKYLVFILIALACAEIIPTVPSDDVSELKKVKRTPIPTLVPSPTRTSLPTNVPTATFIPIPTNTYTTVPTNIPTVTNTNVPLPTRTPTRIPTPTSIPTASPTVVSLEITKTNIYVTFYGYDDNDDGEGHFGTAVISDPVIHPIATEDLGTYDHPSTFATDYQIAKAGTKVYVPRLKKYYIMEDTCVECTADRQRGKTRIDLFIGSNTQLQGQALANCEWDLTLDPYTDTVIFNPSPNHEVNMVPLFSNGICSY